MQKIPLLFSDLDFGCEEFGFISRETGTDVDDEDMAYQRHVRSKTGDPKWQVRDGVLFLRARG